LELVVSIIDVAYGGKGVAREDGQVIFVTGAVPGDRAKVTVTTQKKRYMEAEILELLESSPLRQPSPCSFSDQCGGCQWQEIPYDQQLIWKKSFVESSLKRIGKLQEDLTMTMHGSPQSQNYRNRVLLRLHIDGSGRGRIGYFKGQTRELIPVDQCQIAESPINDFIKFVTTSRFPASNLKLRIEVQVVKPEQRKNLLLTIHPADPKDRERGLDDVVAHLAGYSQVLWGGLMSEIGTAPDTFFDQQAGVTYLTRPGQFQQVNVAHNHNLRDLIASMVDQMQPKRILDVFCGSGNLSLPLIKEGRFVQGVELNKKAIELASSNMERNGLEKSLARYFAEPADKHLRQCLKQNQKFDLLIADPPRQGMPQEIELVKQLAPRHIIYVSCDPTTLGRDLSKLCQDGTYQVESIHCFDFFPNTYHIETVVQLAAN
jgi:23S rRNA (uracil1939-C5)-methyltransferase